MPPREWKPRLEDILESTERIQQYTRDMTFDEWMKDQKTIDAVIRNLEIIGEAAKHVPPDVQAAYPKIPWREKKGIRDILAYEYFGVDKKILWKTVKDDVPVLYAGMRMLLGSNIDPAP